MNKLVTIALKLGILTVNSSCVIVFLSAIYISGPFGIDALGSENPQPSSKELVEMIITGINRNNSQIPALEAVFDVSVQNVGLEKEISQVTTTITGQAVKFVILPKSEFTVKYIISGDAVKYESQGATWISKNGVVTQYAPESESAWMRRRHLIPTGGFPPIDFRSIGITDDSRPIVQILQEDKIVSASFAEKGEKRKLLVSLESSNRSRVTYEFDPERNLLPTIGRALNSDGSTGQLVQLDYQECVPGVWILKTAQIDSFPSKEGRFGSRVGLSLKLNALKTNYDVSDRMFDLDFPNGTLIHDNVQGKSYVVGSNQTLHQKIVPWRKWLWVVFTIPLVVYLFYKTARGIRKLLGLGKTSDTKPNA